MTWEKFIPPEMNDLENRTWEILCEHRGEANPIGMDDLFVAVFSRPVRHRINDTGELRVLLRGLRRRGALIGYSNNKFNPGYFLPATPEEAARFFECYRRRTMTALVQEAAMKRIGLPELLGQLRMEFIAAHDRS
jgi:hypothetical protein